MIVKDQVETNENRPMFLRKKQEIVIQDKPEMFVNKLYNIKDKEIRKFMPLAQSSQKRKEASKLRKS